MSFAPLRAALMTIPFLLVACGGDRGDAPTGAALASVSKDSPNFIKETDMIFGDSAAPVTIVEYASLTCHACAAFHQTIMPTIKKDYIDTGKVKLILREYPIMGGATGVSFAGSVMARCVAEKHGTEAFFTIVDFLFTNFDQWRFSAEGPRAMFLQAASQAGVNEREFEACITRQDLLDIINANVAEARDEFNVEGTPTLFVDGAKVPVLSLDDLKAKLDAALAKATD